VEARNPDARYTGLLHHTRADQDLLVPSSCTDRIEHSCTMRRLPLNPQSHIRAGHAATEASQSVPNVQAIVLQGTTNFLRTSWDKLIVTVVTGRVPHPGRGRPPLVRLAPDEVFMFLLMFGAASLFVGARCAALFTLASGGRAEILCRRHCTGGNRNKSRHTRPRGQHGSHRFRRCASVSHGKQGWKGRTRISMGCAAASYINAAALLPRRSSA
jgi:hypothetical protein